MGANHSMQIVLQILILTATFTGSRANAAFVRDVIAKTLNVISHISQNGNEPNTCRCASRLRPQELLNLVAKQTPVGPPPMLHDSKLHGKVTVEVSVDEKGAVTAVRGVRGHPFALSSAVESVKTWSFMPYKQHGKPRCAVGLITLSYDFRSHAGAHK